MILLINIMRPIFFPFQKLFILFLFIQLLLEVTTTAFFICSSILLVLCLIFEGARPTTPLFIIIIIVEYLQLSLAQAILVALTGFLIFILKFYHINVPLKGPYMIGHKYVHLEHDDRTILIAIYYPTNEKGDRVEWIPQKSYHKTLYDIFFVDPKNKRAPFHLFKFIVSYIEKIWIPVEGNSKYQDDIQNSNKNRLIVFSHGLGAHLNAYTSFCGNWASHGYTVITINHVQDQVCIDYRKCQSEYQADIREYLQERRYRDLLIRVGQIRRVVDEVLDKKLLQKQLNAKFEIKQVIFAGHSYGGACAVATKAFIRQSYPKKHQRLKLFTKIICLDPWFFPFRDEIFTLLKDENILIINSEYFYQQVPKAYSLQKLFTQLKEVTPQLKAFMVDQMGHLGPCDMAYVFGNILQITGSVKFSRYTDYLMALNIVVMNQFLKGKKKEELIEIGNGFLEEHKMMKKGFKVRQQYRTSRELTFTQIKD